MRDKMIPWTNALYPLSNAHQGLVPFVWPDMGTISKWG